MPRARTAVTYGLAVIHPDGVVGWLTNPDCTAETYPTKAEAEKALQKRLKDKRYTWTLPMEIRVYHESKV